MNLATQAYHAGLSIWHNVAKYSNIPDFSGVDVNRVVSEYMENVRPYQPCLAPVEFVLLKEFTELMTYIDGQQENAQLLLTTVKLPDGLHDSNIVIVQEAERKPDHFIKKDVGTVEVLSQYSPNSNSFVRGICKREPFIFIQSWGECKSDLTTFCVNHSTDANLFAMLLFTAEPFIVDFLDWYQRRS